MLRIFTTLTFTDRPFLLGPFSDLKVLADLVHRGTGKIQRAFCAFKRRFHALPCAAYAASGMFVIQIDYLDLLLTVYTSSVYYFKHALSLKPCVNI